MYLQKIKYLLKHGKTIKCYKLYLPIVRMFRKNVLLCYYKPKTYY